MSEPRDEHGDSTPEPPDGDGPAVIEGEGEELEERLARRRRTAPSSHDSVAISGRFERRVWMRKRNGPSTHQGVK